MRVAGVASRLLRAATIRTHIFGSSRSPVRLGRVEWIGSSPSASSFDVPPPSSPAPSDPPSPSLTFTPSGPLSKRNLLQQRQALEKQQRLELKAMFGRLLDKREGELRSKVKKKEEKTTPETESEIGVPSAVDVDEAELSSSSSSTPTSTPRPTQPFFLTTRIHSLLLRLHTKPKRKTQIMYMMKEYKTIERMLKMKANYIVARAWVERWETSEPSSREGLSFEAELRHFYIARLVELITKRKEAAEQPQRLWAQKLAQQEKDKEREQPVREAKKEMWRVKVEMMKEARKTGKFDSRSGLSSKETKMKEANDANSRPGLMQDLNKRIEEHRIKKEKEAKTKGG